MDVDALLKEAQLHREHGSGFGKCGRGRAIRRERNRLLLRQLGAQGCTEMNGVGFRESLLIAKIGRAAQWPDDEIGIGGKGVGTRRSDPAIALAVARRDEARTARIVGQLPAQPVDEEIDVTVTMVRRGTGERVEQLLASDNAAVMLDQCGEHAPLGSREEDAFARGPVHIGKVRREPHASDLFPSLVQCCPSPPYLSVGDYAAL